MEFLPLHLQPLFFTIKTLRIWFSTIHNYVSICLLASAIERSHHSHWQTPFPLANTIPTGKSHRRCKKKVMKVKLFCSCRMPWDPTDKAIPEKQMAQCDCCKKWYHRSCENIPELVYSTNCFWQCKLYSGK